MTFAGILRSHRRRKHKPGDGDTGIYYGGTYSFTSASQNATTSGGAVGVNIDYNVNGFGRNLENGSNAYVDYVTGADSGGNGGGMTGNLLQMDFAANSGERNDLTGGSYTDPGNSTSTLAIDITNGATASNFMTLDTIDDAQVFDGASNGQTVISFNHIENADYGQYGAYIPILTASSQNTFLTVIGNEFANDPNASNTLEGFQTIIKHGVNLYAAANHIDNYNGATVINFSDHSLNNGSESEQICQTQTGNGSGLTNIVAGGGGVTYSQATGAGCVEDIANSYAIEMLANGNNVNDINSGNNTVATFDHTGDWTLGLAGTSGSLHVQGNINATGTISESGVPVIATNTGDWAGTWQGNNSSTFYLATNPNGYISSPSSTLASSSVAFEFYNPTSTAPAFQSIPNPEPEKHHKRFLFRATAAATTTIELYYNTTLASSGIQQVNPLIHCVRQRRYDRGQLYDQHPPGRSVPFRERELDGRNAATDHSQYPSDEAIDMKRTSFAGLVTLAVFLLAAQTAYGAIAFDASSTFNTGTTATSTSVNITVGSNANEMLFVCGLTTSGNSSATYNGVPMTQVALQKGTTDSRTLAMFDLPNPASGTHGILLTTTSTSVPASRLGRASYSGALQTTIVDASSTNNTSTNLAANTSTLTSITANDWGILCERGSGSNGTQIASGTNNTLRTNDVNDALGDTNSPQAAGAISMTMTSASGSFQWYGVMAAFAPFVNVANSPKSRGEIITFDW